MIIPLYYAGDMLYILENAELEAEYPDIQLWRQAHEPIIARDAFTSFMWILFCLPSPMLSCKESYLSLVHIFYVVSITQVSRFFPFGLDRYMFLLQHDLYTPC